MSAWITTREGWFDFEDFQGRTFSPTEVAHSLGRFPRYIGHTKWTYYTAQHSVLMARKCKTGFWKLVNLLHDAPEAYIGDLTAPLKRLILLHSNVLSDLEWKIWTWIATAHQIPPEAINLIHNLDQTAFATEARDLLDGDKAYLSRFPEPWAERVEPWSSEYCIDEWLRSYHEAVDCCGDYCFGPNSDTECVL